MPITRRTFLRRSAITAIGLGAASPLLELSTAYGRPRRAAAPASDKIVVVVNLFGGNDFLNTVVPVAQYSRYREIRPVLGLARESVLALPGRDDLGLNPGMTAMRDLYAAGKLAVVVGAGAPRGAQGLFDHEASQLNLQSGGTNGSSFADAPTGWLGRYLDTVDVGAAPPGIDVGGYATLVLAGAERDALTISSIDSFGISAGFDTAARLAAYRRVQGASTLDRGPAALGRERRLHVLDLSGTLRERTASYAPAVEYPQDNSVAEALLQCAELISAGLGVRALAVGADGFDTHAAQNDGASATDLGNHDYLLMTVSEAVAAFTADMAAHGLGERVVVLVVSEFGRRAYQNTDNGTDHGFAGGMFVVGDAVRGGVYGEYPSLAENRLVLDGNVDVSVDFRRVYATLLGDYLGADPGALLGGDFASLGFIA
jgi:uncharacterized protein (DUF1501 family)